MGRKLKTAFQEEGAVKMASNVDVKKYAQSILQLRREKKNYDILKTSEIKEAYDVASNHGVDRQVLKDSVKIMEAKEKYTEEHKHMVNIYLEANGQSAWYDIKPMEDAA